MVNKIKTWLRHARLAVVVVSHKFAVKIVEALSRYGSKLVFAEGVNVP